MILIIRGHIRKSFTNTDLLNFIKEIYNIEPDLKIYIHTWSIFSNNISWRTLEIDDTCVTKEIFYDYFGELKHLIQEIIIDDDSNIQLIGNLQGKINEELWHSNDGLTPLIGWKNYWYGKYRIIKYIYDDININPDEIIVNFRFDIIINNSDRVNLFLDLIKNNKKSKFTKNKFLFDYEQLGIDNIYIGNINTMYSLIHKFHHELDDILIKNKDTIHQELFVYRENEKIFTN